MVVVLPAPLGPRRPKISPRPTVNEMWSTATAVAVVFGEVLGLDDGILGHRRPNLATAPTMTRSATPMMPTPAMPHIVEVVTVTRNVLEADSPRAEARIVVT